MRSSVYREVANTTDKPSENKVVMSHEDDLKELERVIKSLANNKMAGLKNSEIKTWCNAAEVKMYEIKITGFYQRES